MVGLVDDQQVEAVSQRVGVAQGAGVRHEALSYQQVAEKFSMILGKEIQYIPLSEEEAQNEFISMGIPVEKCSNFSISFCCYSKWMVC